MKNLPDREFKEYVSRTRKNCSEHPVITALIVTTIVLAIAAIVFAIYKLACKEEDIFEDDWDLDDDESFVYASDDELDK